MLKASKDPTKELAPKSPDIESPSLDAMQSYYARSVQAKMVGPGEPPTGDVQATAMRGLGGSAQRLPYLELIQRAFGRHRVDDVEAFVGGPAAEAASSMQAEAYTVGRQIAFGGPPSLHTAAHEAAHVIQQRSGARPSDGVGRVNDDFEQHADQVADCVVQGGSAEGLLDRFGSDPPTPSAPATAIQHIMKATEQDKRVFQHVKAEGEPSADRYTLFDHELQLYERVSDKELFRYHAETDSLAPHAKVDAGAAAGSKMLAVEQSTSSDLKTRSLDSGVWYRHDFIEACKLQNPDPKPAAYHHRMRGYADEKFFAPATSKNVLRILPGVNASEALAAFFRGPTIAECFSLVCAVAYQGLLEQLGAEKFNHQFGSKDVAISEVDRLCIEGGGSINRSNPLSRYLMLAPVAQDTAVGMRPVKRGDLCYFQNHPDYPKRHPEGAGSGWNVVCTDDTPGAQKWTGFGLGSAALTEPELLERLAFEYNLPTTNLQPAEFAASTSAKELSTTPGCGFLPKARVSFLSTPRVGDCHEPMTSDRVTRSPSLRSWIIQINDPNLKAKQTIDAVDVPPELHQLAARGWLKHLEMVNLCDSQHSFTVHLADGGPDGVKLSSHDARSRVSTIVKLEALVLMADLDAPRKTQGPSVLKEDNGYVPPKKPVFNDY